MLDPEPEPESKKDVNDFKIIKLMSIYIFNGTIKKAHG